MWPRYQGKCIYCGEFSDGPGYMGELIKCYACLWKEERDNINLLKKWIEAAIIRGRAAVDKANEEFGYDSIRFADVRHGWLETIGNIKEIPIEYPAELNVNSKESK